MAGMPVFTLGDPYGSYAPPGAGGGSGVNRATASPAAAANTNVSHVSFVVWLVLIGIVLPVAILGGLRMGGFSFVFKGR